MELSPACWIEIDTEGVTPKKGEERQEQKVWKLSKSVPGQECDAAYQCKQHRTTGGRVIDRDKFAASVAGP